MATGLDNLKLKEDGAALLIAMLVLAAMMAAGLGAAALTLGQTAITRLVDDSVKAVFAADAGMEKLFYYTNRLGGDPTGANFKKVLETGATDFVSCPAGETCYFACAPGQGCTADVLKSRGEFGDAQRSFEAAY